MLKKSACHALFPLAYAALAILLVALAMRNGLWPAETNAMYPLYCGDLIYRSVQQGIWYPFYDTMWFAGSETLRSFGPLPAYLLAACQALANGDHIGGAYLFLGLLFFGSACIWLWIGDRLERPFLGGLFGIIWFFMPYNIHTLMVQGGLARSLAYCALPLLFFRTRDYLKEPDWKKLPFFGVCFLLLALTHPGCAAVTALAWIAYLLFWRFFFHNGRGIAALTGMGISGTMAAGLWLVPYLTGGALRGDFSREMAASFQPLADSLNAKAYWMDPRDAVYFGLALFAVCLVVGIFSRRDSMPEVWTALLLLPCTSTVCYVAIRILPGSVFLRAVWLFSAAAALGFLALINWNTVQKPLTVLLTLLLLADTLPAFRLFLPDHGAVVPAEERMEEVMTATLRDKAQAITTQRLAILDEDATGAEGIYLASCWKEPVPILGGVGRNQSGLSANLTQLDRAVREGCYLYVFDRCLEMGCDTVLLQTALVKAEDLAGNMVEQAAHRLGYQLVDDNGSYQLYHCELGSNWGTVSDYPAIGIGSATGYASIAYPAMQETSDTNLNHYTFEQLSAYELVFLSGFTYDDCEVAEELVLRLSEAGVRVVISADGIPKTKTTHSRSFLGVLCNDIEFSNGYPELDTIDGILNTKLFPPGYSKWSTVYVEGLDDVWGYVLDNDLRLPFYGTVKNDNIVIIGLNLHHFFALTRDETVEKLLNHGMELPAGRLPERMAVPLEIAYDRDSITLTTDFDGVNTGLSAHDSFDSPAIRFENNLTVVDHGTTVIRLRYPHVDAGRALSVTGILLMCIRPLCRRRDQKAANAKMETENKKGSGEDTA